MKLSLKVLLYICIGSVIVFILSKKYGVQPVKSIIKEKAFEKYSAWMDKGKKFDQLFAYAIFFLVHQMTYYVILQV